MRETAEKGINALKQLIKGKIHSRTRNLLLFILFSVLLESSERFGTRQSITGQGKRWETTNNRPFCCSSLWWKDPKERCLGVKRFTQNQSHYVYVGSYFPNRNGLLFSHGDTFKMWPAKTHLTVTVYLSCSFYVCLQAIPNNPVWHNTSTGTFWLLSLLIKLMQIINICVCVHVRVCTHIINVQNSIYNVFTVNFD